MPGKPLGVAFVGTGDTSEANVKANLDDWLREADPDGNELQYNPPIIPEVVRKSHKGLQRCADWLAEEFGDSIAVVPLADIVAELVAARDDEDDPADVALAYVPGGDDDPHLDVVKAALRAGVPVKDITQGLIDFKLPAPTETEDEKPAGRRVRGRAREDGERGPESDSKGLDESPTQSPTEPAESPAASSSASSSAYPAAGMQVVLSQATVAAILEAFGLMAEDIKASVVEGLPASAKPKERKVAAYYHDGDGTYRVVEGRGRPRAGESRVELTVAEATELGLEFG